MVKENYFLNCHSEESIKIRYKKLANELHPDKNPDDPEATANFQDMCNQRDDAFRRVYKNSGKTSKELETELENFVSNLNKDLFKGLDKVATSFAEKWVEENPDKEPTFGDVFRMVFGGLKKAHLNNENKKRPLPGHINPDKLE